MSLVCPYSNADHITDVFWYSAKHNITVCPKSKGCLFLTWSFDNAGKSVKGIGWLWDTNHRESCSNGWGGTKLVVST